MTSLAIDFFVIGAQKCATSWLFYCLREHPEIQLHRKKDEDNYVGGPRYAERGAPWFAGLYGPRAGRAVRGAVSVNYLYDRRALEYVLKAYPQAKFVVCLRNPLERTASAYQYMARKDLLPAREFNVGMRAALAARGQGRARGVEAELIQRSLYAGQLEAVVQARAVERLLVVGYEWLCADPRDTLRAIYRFLGVRDDYAPASFDRRPKRSANIPLLTRIERLGPQSRVMGKLMDHANQWLCRAGLDRKRPLFDPDVEAALREIFAPDVAHLEQIMALMPPGQALLPPRAGSLWSLGP